MTCDDRMEVKDPQDDLDYGWDYRTKWLAATDKITASTWTSSPAGLTLHNPTFDDDTTTVWASGGTLDTAYVLVNHITTFENRQRDRCFTLIVKDCGD